ncbi:MAG: hypothetical protein PHU06_08735 [Gallionella sp.]|nr:hypothetical protein [Gallionella sp.]MDD4959564.1 hypothetical protein [Gallionella sp.]
MDEQQAVLDFFAKIENLPLGLAVAEQMDLQREQLNNMFWRDLQQRLTQLNLAHTLPWQLIHTEDRNTPDNLVGLQGLPEEAHPNYLHPMLEQQNLGGGMRIYIGLMWHAAPTPEQLNLPAITTLKATLQLQGYKDNDRFLAWKWTKFHPRRRDFLLRYTQDATSLLDDLSESYTQLTLMHHDPITQANLALAALPRSMIVSFKKT